MAKKRGMSNGLNHNNRETETSVENKFTREQMHDECVHNIYSDDKYLLSLAFENPWKADLLKKIKEPNILNPFENITSSKRSGIDMLVVCRQGDHDYVLMGVEVKTTNGKKPGKNKGRNQLVWYVNEVRKHYNKWFVRFLLNEDGYHFQKIGGSSAPVEVSYRAVLLSQHIPYMDGKGKLSFEKPEKLLDVYGSLEAIYLGASTRNAAKVVANRRHLYSARDMAR